MNSDAAEYWGEESGGPLSAKDRMRFAGRVLGGIALLFILAGLAAISHPDSGGPIFDAAVKILPPIATLIIGFYFSRAESM